MALNSIGHLSAGDARWPKKSLGQHFLTCPWVISSILDALGNTPVDTVVEIGPGTGVLTWPLARRAGRVIAIEKDERLAALLEQETGREGITNIEVVRGDILTLLADLEKKWGLEPGRYRIVGNLPYYLTGKLLRTLFEGGLQPLQSVCMVQKEVARRLMVHAPDMNLLALSVQAYTTPTVITDVPATCFRPRPKVDSSVVAFSMPSDNFFRTHNIRPKEFYLIARRAFSQKRKLVTNTLGAHYGKTRVLEALDETGLSPHARPQELSVTQWGKITRLLAHA